MFLRTLITSLLLLLLFNTNFAFAGCIAPPNFNVLDTGQKTIDLTNNNNQWISTGRYITSNKSLKLAWDTSSLIAPPRKYRVFYRIDPRFNRPQVIIKQYNYSNGTWKSDFDSYLGQFSGPGSLVAYQNGSWQNSNTLKIAQDYVNYFGFGSGRNPIVVNSGDIISINIINAGSFFNTPGYPNIDNGPDQSASQIYMYTSTMLNVDNRVLYSSINAFCSYLNANPSIYPASTYICSSASTLFSPLPSGTGSGPFISGAIGKLNLAPLPLCQSGTDGLQNSACYYDNGRGMTISVAGNIVKPTYQPFTTSFVTGQPVFSTIASYSGVLDFNTSWSIGGMFSQEVGNRFVTFPYQFMSSWTSTTQPTSAMLQQMWLNYLHVGRYFLEVEIGSSTGAIDQSAINVEYIISNDPPTGEGYSIIANDEVFPSNGGMLWVKVNASNNPTGTMTIYYAHYTGDTSLSDFVLNDIVNPICNAVQKVSKNLYYSLSSTPRLKSIALSALNLYVILYSLFFLAGAVSVKLSDLVSRVIKITLVVTMFSSKSWAIFNSNLFVIFSEGMSSLVYKIIGTNSNNNMFGFIDFIFAKYLNEYLWANLLIEFLDFYSGLTFWSILVMVGLWKYLFTLLETIIAYIMAFIMISVLISLAPIFMIFLLFSKTAHLFRNWLSAIFNAALYPTVFILFFFMIDDILVAQLQHAVLGSCWDDNWFPITLNIGISIPGYIHHFTPIQLFAIPFYAPNASNGNIVSGDPSSYLGIASSSIIFFCLANMTSNLSAYVTSIVGSLTSIGLTGGGLAGQEGAKSIFDDIGNAPFAAIRKPIKAAQKIVSFKRAVTEGLETLQNLQTNVPTKSDTSTASKASPNISPASSEFTSSPANLVTGSHPPTGSTPTPDNSGSSTKVPKTPVPPELAQDGFVAEFANKIVSKAVENLSKTQTTATPEDVEKAINNAYKKLALTYHPDKNSSNPNAVLDFQNLGNAKEALLNNSQYTNALVNAALVGKGAPIKLDDIPISASANITDNNTPIAAITNGLSPETPIVKTVEPISKVDSKVPEQVHVEPSSATNINPDSKSNSTSSAEPVSREQARKDKAEEISKETDAQIGLHQMKSSEKVRKFRESLPDPKAKLDDIYNKAKKSIDNVNKDGEEFVNRQLKKGKDLSDKVAKKIKEKTLDPVKKSIDKSTKSVSDFTTKQYNKVKDSSNKLAGKVKDKASIARAAVLKRKNNAEELAKKLANNVNKSVTEKVEKIRDDASTTKHRMLRISRKKTEAAQIRRAKLAEMLVGKKSDILHKDIEKTKYVNDPKLSKRENARKERAHNASQELDAILNTKRKSALSEVQDFHKKVSATPPAKLYKGAKKLGEDLKKGVTEKVEKIRDDASTTKHRMLRISRKKTEAAQIRMAKLAEMLGGKKSDILHKDIEKTKYVNDPKLSKRENARKERAHNASQELDAILNTKRQTDRKQVEDFHDNVSKFRESLPDPKAKLDAISNDAKKAVINARKDGEQFANRQLQKGKELSTKVAKNIQEKAIDPAKKAVVNARKDGEQFANKQLQKGKELSTKVAKNIKDRAIDPVKKSIDKSTKSVSDFTTKQYNLAKDASNNLAENLRDKASSTKHAVLRRKRKTEELSKIDKAKIREMLGGKKTDALNKPTTFTQYVDDPKLSARENARKEKAYYAAQKLDHKLNQERTKAKKQVESFHEAVSTSAPAKLYRGVKEITENVRDKASDVKHAVLRRKRKTEELSKIDKAKIREMLGGKKTDALNKPTTFTQYVDDPKLSARENARKEKAYYAAQKLDHKLNQERTKAKKQVESFHEAVSTSAPGKLYKGAKKLADDVNKGVKEIKEGVKDKASIAKHTALNKIREKKENIKTDAKEFVDMVGGQGFSDKLAKDAKDNIDDFRKLLNEAKTETKNIISDYKKPISKSAEKERKKKDKQNQKDYERNLKNAREREEERARKEKERILEAAKEKQRLLDLARALQAEKDAKKDKDEE